MRIKLSSSWFKIISNSIEPRYLNLIESLGLYLLALPPSFYFSKIRSHTKALVIKRDCGYSDTCLDIINTKTSLFRAGGLLTVLDLFGLRIETNLADDEVRGNHRQTPESKVDTKGGDELHVKG